MLTYILRRLLLMVVTMFMITFIIVSIMLLTPGEPGQLNEMGPGTGPGGSTNIQASKGMILAKMEMGFFDANGDKLPPWTAWWNWVGKFASFDLGKSAMYHMPVTELLLERVPVTLLLNTISLLIIYLISLPLGIFSATHQNTLADSTSSTVLFVLYSMPNWWVATMLIVCFASVNLFDWFDVDGLHAIGSERFTLFEYLWDSGKRMILPVICLVYGSFAYLSRQMRTGMLDVVRQDYIRTARAKGLDDRTVIYRHALRNALIPIITLVAFLLPAMLGGSIIIELIFSIRGMGLLGFEAILNRDYLVVMANLTVAAVLTLVGILGSDLLYCMVDPRISLD
ncbi:MAG: diguanylate cyclase [Planctomycetes bacterium]|nr:diguanylate cyclase [Planctomycetota bacterium]